MGSILQYFVVRQNVHHFLKYVGLRNHHKSEVSNAPKHVPVQEGSLILLEGPPETATGV